MNLLSEQELRPTEFMDGQRIALLTDLGRMLSRRAEFVWVSCPACGENNVEHKYQKNGINYVLCKSCETFYVNPRPSTEVLDWFYQGSPNYAYWNDYVFPASQKARLEKIFVPRVDRLLEICERYGANKESILEVGAGYGTFCGEVKRRNAFKRIVAVEPTPKLAETCRSLNLEVIELPVEKIFLDSRELFDVVVSFEVIEHLFDPSIFLEHMRRLLKPGGVLILTCPNGHGFDIQTLGVLSDTVDHEHLNYFNPDSLNTLLSANEFETLENFTPGVLDAELVRNKILSGEFDVSNQPFLKTVLIDQWSDYGEAFQEYLMQQNLSSNLWVVAKSHKK